MTGLKSDTRKRCDKSSVRLTGDRHHDFPGEQQERCRHDALGVAPYVPLAHFALQAQVEACANAGGPLGKRGELLPGVRGRFDLHRHE